MKTLRIAISNYEMDVSREMAIAEGKRKREFGKPFSRYMSFDMFAKNLTDENIDLIQLIAAKKPKSIKELALISEKEESKILSILSCLEAGGFVNLNRIEGGQIIPTVPYEDISIHIPVRSF